MGVLLPSIVRYCDDNDYKTAMLQTGTKIPYFNVLEGRTDIIQFRDVLSYTSPCSLDKFLRQWKTTQTKGCFPHG